MLITFFAPLALLLLFGWVAYYFRRPIIRWLVRQEQEGGSDGYSEYLRDDPEIITHTKRRKRNKSEEANQ